MEEKALTKSKKMDKKKKDLNAIENAMENRDFEPEEYSKQFLMIFLKIIRVQRHLSGLKDQ